MSTITGQNIVGAIKVAGLPDTVCFKNQAELIRALAQYLVLDIGNQQFSNIVISNQQPGQADRNKIWARQSNSGLFLGFYVYNGTIWAQVLPTPNGIEWLYGSSDSPPPGYTFVSTGSMVGMSGAQYTALINIAATVTGGGAPYVYYPAVFTGI